MTTRHRSRKQPGPIAWLFPPRSPEIVLHRRRQWSIAVVVLLIGLMVADHLHPRRPAASQPVKVDDFTCYHDHTFRVTHVVDGDTVHVDAPDGDKHETIIRLWGVDTPEMHGVEVPEYYGPEAFRFVRGVVLEQAVRLELVPGKTRDRYGRLLAYVYLPDGSMLNEQLIEQGYAYADTRFPHPFKAKFVKLEKRARQDRIGLWQNVTPEKMPAWRRQNKGSTSKPSAGG